MAKMPLCILLTCDIQECIFFHSRGRNQRVLGPGKKERKGRKEERKGTQEKESIFIFKYISLSMVYRCILNNSRIIESLQWKKNNGTK